MFNLYAKYIDGLVYVEPFITSESRDEARSNYEETWKNDPDFIGFVNGEDQ